MTVITIITITTETFFNDISVIQLSTESAIIGQRALSALIFWRTDDVEKKLLKYTDHKYIYIYIFIKEYYCYMFTKKIYTRITASQAVKTFLENTTIDSSGNIVIKPTLGVSLSPENVSFCGLRFILHRVVVKLL